MQFHGSPVGTPRAEQELEIEGENTVQAVSWRSALSWEGPSACSAAGGTSQICAHVHLVCSQLSEIGNGLVLWTARLEKKPCSCYPTLALTFLCYRCPVLTWPGEGCKG